MFKRERHLFSNYNCNKLNKTDMLSLRENLNGAGRVLRVAGKMSRVRNIFFLKQAFGRTFFRIQPCYVSGNVDGNPAETCYRFGPKSD